VLEAARNERGAAKTKMTAKTDPSRPQTKRWVPARASWPAFCVIAVIAAASSVAHLWSLRRDLPLHDQDEAAFVGPAVHIAATWDLNPHWFGHPGSTVIYPLALFFRVWNLLFHQGSLLASDSALTQRLYRHPTEFYLIGRFWSVALAIGALPLVFLIGRRVFDTRAGLVATAIWAVLPFPVFHAQIVRTDSAAVFFGLLALWLCLRLLDEPRVRFCVLAGVGVGLAVASRYFMVALVPCLVMAAVLPHRRAPRAALRSGAIAVASAVGGFVISTPYFVLDPHAVLESLRVENAPLGRGSGGLSHLGNLRWYLGTAIPDSFTWPLVVLATVGVVLVIRTRRVGQLLLLVFCGSFLVGISASQVHQRQWVIQLLPVLTLLAAFAIVAITDALLAPLDRVLRIRILTPVVLVAITAVLVVEPVTKLARADADASTGRAARDWIVNHIPPGSRLIEDSINVPLHGAHLHVDYRLDGPPRAPIRYVSFGSSQQYLRLDRHTRPLAFYQQAGYEYLVVNRYWIDQATNSSARYPREEAFYRDLVCQAQLIAGFGPTDTRHGWPIHIYQLTRERSPQTSCPRNPDAMTFCSTAVDVQEFLARLPFDGTRKPEPETVRQIPKVLLPLLAKAQHSAPTEVAEAVDTFTQALRVGILTGTNPFRMPAVDDAARIINTFMMTNCGHPEANITGLN
jgi:Dolichyl-phosphate-mannose-protein mannosyltransferase